MEKAVCTSGVLTLQDQKIKSSDYHFVCVGRLINILVLFLVATSYLDRKIQYHENRTFLFCLSICTWSDPEGGLEPCLKNHKNIALLNNIAGSWTPEKSQSYQTSFQCWANIDTPAKRHLNGV